MLFANYIYNGKNINNLGDHIQILTIEYIYQQMGISPAQIVSIEKDQLAAYDGEPVVLPVSMPLIDYVENGIAGMFSEKIRPVFLGLTLAKDTLYPAEVAYLKRYTPIGCRDERTLNTMLRYGIDAYLGGCMTAVLPRRAPDAQRQKRVFFVDLPQEVVPFLPKELSDIATVETHLFYGDLPNAKEMARARYALYRDEAALVVTSLLHGTVPCMAMGIPVVLVRNTVSYRFGWLESLLPIYTPEEYVSIDWSPNPTMYEAHKSLLFRMIQNRLLLQDDSAQMQAVHTFYMNRTRKQYVVDAFDPLHAFLDQNWKDHSYPYRYSIWGLTQMAEIAAHYIEENYPNAVLCHVYDKSRALRFRDLIAESPEHIAQYPDETVLVTTVSAAFSAREFFQSIGRPQNMYGILDIVR